MIKFNDFINEKINIGFKDWVKGIFITDNKNLSSLVLDTAFQDTDGDALYLTLKLLNETKKTDKLFFNVAYSSNRSIFTIDKYNILQISSDSDFSFNITQLNKKYSMLFSHKYFNNLNEEARSINIDTNKTDNEIINKSSNNFDNLIEILESYVKELVKINKGFKVELGYFEKVATIKWEDGINDMDYTTNGIAYNKSNNPKVIDSIGDSKIKADEINLTSTKSPWSGIINVIPSTNTSTSTTATNSISDDSTPGISTTGTTTQISAPKFNTTSYTTGPGFTSTTSDAPEITAIDSTATHIPVDSVIHSIIFYVNNTESKELKSQVLILNDKKQIINKAVTTVRIKDHNKTFLNKAQVYKVINDGRDLNTYTNITINESVLGGKNKSIELEGKFKQINSYDAYKITDPNNMLTEGVKTFYNILNEFNGNTIKDKIEFVLDIPLKLNTLNEGLFDKLKNLFVSKRHVSKFNIKDYSYNKNVLITTSYAESIIAKKYELDSVEDRIICGLCGHNSDYLKGKIGERVDGTNHLITFLNKNFAAETTINRIRILERRKLLNLFISPLIIQDKTITVNSKYIGGNISLMSILSNTNNLKSILQEELEKVLNILLLYKELEKHKVRPTEYKIKFIDD